MWKNCNVVMLATKNESNIYLFNNKLYYKPKATIGLPVNWQYIYFLSDEKIVEGEWCINIDTKQIGKCIQKSEFSIEILYDDGLNTSKSIIKTKGAIDSFKKIIATTDTSYITDLDKFKACLPSEKEKLHNSLLPQPPQQFIEKHIEEYNKGNIISKVDVEYEDEPIEIGNFIDYGEKYNGKSLYKTILKVNSDNTINIKPIKDSWSREEVIALINNYDNRNRGNSEYQSTHKWIEENI